ncbi:MAG: SAM-dependent methyltransferase [Cyanobacteria bacterium REEB65]|nr:SAM-dependent methyltransferase [Cyanobacteria bacterium REEB65]
METATPIRERLLARLTACGRLTVAEFMAEALYGPYGYYRKPRNPVGPDGDFYTSARVHPAFAALLAVQIAQLWEHWDRPDRFDIVEPGAGAGTLAADLAHALEDYSPHLARAIRYQPVDWQPAAIAAEPAWPELPQGIRGVVLANELLDALPVRRIQRWQGEIHELCVVVEDGRFVERRFAPADDLRVQARLWAPHLAEGGIAEVQLALLDWVQHLATALEAGLVILLDYARERSEWPISGTLRAFRRHRVVADPFEDPGNVDLTSDVDLVGLLSAAQAADLEIGGLTTQSAFLTHLGMPAIHDALARSDLESAAKQANLAALRDLVDPHGLGAFKAIALARGLRDLALVGWTGGGQPAAAPILTHRHMSLW